MSFKSLSPPKKIKQILDRKYASKQERNFMAMYIKALRNGIEASIEKYGDCHFKMCYNYDRMQYNNYKWHEVYFNKNGYIEKIKQLELEF